MGHVYEKLLVAVDGSAHADRAVVRAAELARLAGSSVRVVHACERTLSPAGMWYPEVEARRVTDRAVARVRQRGVQATGMVLRALQGTAAVAICDAADDAGADLIVIGARGRTGLAELLLGSVALRVILLARQPVLVTR